MGNLYKIIGLLIFSSANALANNPCQHSEQIPNEGVRACRSHLDGQDGDIGRRTVTSIDRIMANDGMRAAFLRELQSRGFQINNPALVVERAQ
jgi:hypothetical protein